MKLIFWISLFLSLTISWTYRLPTDILPIHYDLQIITNLDDNNNNNNNLTFTGKVWIEIKCVQTTSTITLHIKSLEINIKEISIKRLDGEINGNLKVLSVDFDKDNDFMIIKLSQSLKKDERYELYIPFSGVLLENLTGYYKSSYVDVTTNKKRWLATTQFEPISAREAFPCFDEPAMKATFNITLGRKENYSSLSNMPKLSTLPMEDKPGWFWDKYQKSLRMSTYLVAYIVSDFDYKTSRTKENNITFKVWSRKDAINQIDYASEMGPLILEFYEKFFDIKYPLPKEDLIAIPDFASGAMENWGLITYRESNLLCNPKETSLISKEYIGIVIAHELAHQWFGDLVTMKWWSDLWLNEGFATYMSGLALNAIRPTWRSLVNSNKQNLLDVFSLDSLESSHPVSVPIENPKMISEIFDTITYKKGSSVINMMSNFLGKENFQKGVSNYLKKHQYQNAEQDDLWDSLTEQAHKENVIPKNLTVKIIMDTWTLQTGYPVITINRLKENNAIVLNQERFLSTIAPNSKYSSCWWIPISYTTQEELDFKNTEAKHWMSCSSKRKIIEGVAKDDKWFIFNIQFNGIYRINYDENNWKLLIKTLNSDSFNHIALANRVQLIDDSAHLAWRGDLEYSILFDILTYLKQEEEALPWLTAVSNLKDIEKFFFGTNEYELFSKYGKKLITPIYDKIGGFDEQKHFSLDQIRLRDIVNTWSCTYGIEDCIRNAIMLFKNYQENPEANTIPKDYRAVVYRFALKHGGEEEWEFLWKEFQKSNVATEKENIIYALGSTRKIGLLKRYLEWSLDEKYIRKQNSFQAFSSVVNNPAGYNIAKEFVENRFKDIRNSQIPKYAMYLRELAKYITKEKTLNEFKNFIETNQKYLTETRDIVDQSLETAKINVQWDEKHFHIVKSLFEKY